MILSFTFISSEKLVTKKLINVRITKNGNKEKKVEIIKEY